MTNDWILFLRDDDTHLDVVLYYGRDVVAPYSGYAITARNGKVYRSTIIETRVAVAEKEVNDANR